MSPSTRLAISLLPHPQPTHLHSLAWLAVGTVHLPLMLGKTVIGGMKVTCCVDEVVGAAEGRPGHTGGVTEDYLSWPPTLFSAHPKEIRKPRTNRLVPGYPISTWSPPGPLTSH